VAIARLPKAFSPLPGKPARLRLTADRTVLQADGQDLSFITVEAVDADGQFQPVADQERKFTA